MLVLLFSIGRRQSPCQVSRSSLFISVCDAAYGRASAKFALRHLGKLAIAKCMRIVAASGLLAYITVEKISEHRRGISLRRRPEAATSAY
jgi:hypothetical protein